MISKTIGFRGTLFSDTPIYNCTCYLFWWHRSALKNWEMCHRVARAIWVPGFGSEVQQICFHRDIARWTARSQVMSSANLSNDISTDSIKDVFFCSPAFPSCTKLQAANCAGVWGGEGGAKSVNTSAVNHQSPWVQKISRQKQRCLT